LEGADKGKKRYRYYNCSTRTRQEKQACPGHRIRTEVLDAAVLEYLAGVVCTDARAEALRTELRRRAANGVARAGQRSHLKDALAEVRARIADWSAVADHSQHHRELAERRAREMRAQVDGLQEQIDAAVQEAVASDDLEEITVAELRDAWRKVVAAGGIVSRSYLHRLVDRIEIDETGIRVIPRRSDEASAEK
jgi:site-specific DNA recombinase